MTDRPIQFDDGAAYEEFMGKWTRIAGATFLDWFAPPPARRWLDVGCGNGAFTELVASRFAPAGLAGVDPSPQQIAYARTRPGLEAAELQVGDAMALPYPDATFDIAVMALVLFFVPEPAQGVAEMRRVTKLGGSIAAYAWDIHGGGFPLAAMQTEMRALGMKPVLPPSADASTQAAMRGLWQDAGLVDIELTAITAERVFADFDAYWAASLQSPSLAAALATKPPELVDQLKARTRARLPLDAQGRIVITARANAVKGRVPG